MNTHMIVELVGYFGSALVLLSFLMTSVVKLRIINMAGGVICTIYSLVIDLYDLLSRDPCISDGNHEYLSRFDQFLLFDADPENGESLRCD